jgi:Cu(I)/Ag(I) efflux system membrane fusion protein
VAASLGAGATALFMARDLDKDTTRMADRPGHDGPAASADTASPPSTSAPGKRLYQCPMHPSITSDHPGDCPICGMKLVEVTGAAAPGTPAAQAGTGAASGAAALKGLATVTIDPARQQMIGLRTTPALRGPVSDTWRTVGRVEVDPTRVRRVNVKIDGYVEKAFVSFVGQKVRRGDPLFSLYSPSLLAAQNEYLLALSTRRQLAMSPALATNGDDLVKAARRKLELWDVPEKEIAKLEATGEANKALTLVSPIAGVVTAKNIVEGSRVNPGDTPYEITDLGMVWVMADAYETDLGRARVGAKATMVTKSLPGRSFQGRVQFVDPVIDPKTRTTKVHLHFANQTGELKPDMYGEVELQGKTTMGIQIPADAILHAGTQDMVFVALGDGKFEPRKVKVGVQGGGMVQIAEGLRDGEQVVSHANFLIDSESRLRASLASIGVK